MHSLAAFLGAFLLFDLELLSAQTLLPFYGGGYQVWITCLVFSGAAAVRLLLRAQNPPAF